MATLISVRISGYNLCLEFVINQHFSRYCCSYRKLMRDLSKTALSLKRSRNLSREKIERIDRSTRHVSLQNYTIQYGNPFTTSGSLKIIPVSPRHMEVFMLLCILIMYDIMLCKRIVRYSCCRYMFNIEHRKCHLTCIYIVTYSGCHICCHKNRHYSELYLFVFCLPGL